MTKLCRLSRFHYVCEVATPTIGAAVVKDQHIVQSNLFFSPPFSVAARLAILYLDV